MKIAKVLLVLALAALLTTSLFGCTKKPTDSRVAATVNGVEIMEADVTKRIEYYRAGQFTGQALDDVEWATSLATNGYTPESFREAIIRNDFAFHVLLLQKAEAQGIVPNSELINTTLKETKTNLQNDNLTFEEYLHLNGFATEEAYRAVLECNNIIPQVVEKMITVTPPSQADIDTFVSENAAPFSGKRVSVIYLAPDEADPTKTTAAARAQAQEAYTQLINGADFATTAAKYMKDELGENGGDLGWGKEYLLPQEVSDALDGLEIGVFTEVIEVKKTASEDDFADDADDAEAAEVDASFFIAVCTADFPLTDEEYFNPVDIEKVPSEVVENLTKMFLTQHERDAQSEFFLAIANSPEILINPMPEGLSYNVNMSLAVMVDDEEDPFDDPHNNYDHYSPYNLPDLPEMVFSDNGLGIIDVVVGDGAEVQEGDLVEVHYVGSLMEMEGRVFDNSYDRGSPYPVTVGAGGVIKGWDLGLVGMRVGGVRILEIPAGLAYGDAAVGSIPANSQLTFQVEIVSANGDSTGHSGEIVSPLQRSVD